MTQQNKANNLISEKSPYLQQHAYNPVNWYPWGDQAFNKAKQEDKPIFLSIGYSTCHWCHVFARESFEDEVIAAYLNEHFVSIKVDREERPDIDAIYMKVCQMMTGQGGWPLSIFMTPEQVPFYAGTYFPRDSKYGLPGFSDVITQLNHVYQEDPEQIANVTKSVTDALPKTISAKSENRLTQETADKAYKALKKQFDLTNGGFGDSPKFPTPHTIMFLLRYYYFKGETEALEMAEKTLQQMAAGGIYDHIGFGFARYSTDESWLVPHFEKMLYDNALLLMAYTECYQVTANPLYKTISEQIITFVMREMHNGEGGFYSAIDADSEGIEGQYYVWDYNEILEVLGKERGVMFADAYGITREGNFAGSNIPNLLHTDLDQMAASRNMTTAALKQELDAAREQLLTKRHERVYPHIDDKVLTSWNAMMTAALAKAGKVFQEQHYTNAAEETAAFIEQNLVENNRVMARYRDGDVKYAGYLDDYAFLIRAYAELYEATFSQHYLQMACRLTDNMIDLFWDTDEGGFFLTGHDSERLLSREKHIYDDALPSGNGVAAMMLATMGFLTGNTAYLDKLDSMYYTFYDALKRVPDGGIHFVQSLLLLDNPTKEAVVLGDIQDAFIANLQQTFLPDVTLLASADPQQLAQAAPFVADYQQIEQQLTVYVCENFACHEPTTDPEKAWQSIYKRSWDRI
ncbi:thioredoxin domain-containing protein [Barrientosiimonas marina]|uniref:Thioredoxin domain-containing protein n=1 Tax=Lentibacillus kimchii TaxID=1542911 RepID=A0ABW2UZF2_9BACI